MASAGYGRLYQQVERDAIGSTGNLDFLGNPDLSAPGRANQNEPTRPHVLR
jgi:hypothetical protein